MNSNTSDPNTSDSKYLCPITQSTFTDPVMAQDGHTYERSAIQEWFKNNDTSPLTRLPINKNIITNNTIRSEMSHAGYILKSLNNTNLSTTNLSTTNLSTTNLSGVKITLVLDISGSMKTSVESKNTNEPSMSRLDLIKHAVTSIGAMMRPNDQLSIVTFNNSALVTMPWTRMDFNGKERNMNIAKNLYANGGTNIPAGIELGTSLNADHTILLTDGANTEYPPRGTLSDYIINKIANYRGRIHSIGLGMADDLDTPTLRAVSSNKNGFYCFCPDASMVGTVFVHLMANIIVNEPGTPFPEHTLFLKTIIDIYNTKNLDLLKTQFTNPILNDDLISINDNRGQIQKALLNWNTWGRHYLPAFIDAHIKCMTTNFKDQSIQGYASSATRAFIDNGEAIFKSIVPPIPSCNNQTQNAYTQQQFSQISMLSSGSCFDLNTVLQIYENGVTKTCKIKDIKKGMMVLNRNSYNKVLCLVVSPSTKMINIGTIDKEFWVSERHPVRKDSEWKYPCEFPNTASELRECYNLVLETGHIISIGDFEAVTLGHGIKGGIVEHDYLGTNKVVDDLSKFKEFHNGFIRLNGLKRNEFGICGIII